MERGKLLSRSIDFNQDGDKKVRLLEVELSEEDDQQESELQAVPGCDYNPPDDSWIFVYDVTESYEIVVCVDDGSEPDSTIEPGEMEWYSLFDGERKATIRWNVAGELVLNKGTGYGAEYNALETAFNELLTSHNALVAAVNALTLPVNVTTLIAGPPAAPVAQPSEADITPSKVEKVRI